MLAGLARGLAGLTARLGQRLARVLQRRLGEDIGLVLGTRVDEVLRVHAGASGLTPTAERTADAAQGIGELARDDPHLVGVTGRDLRQDLQVLVGQQLLRRLAAVDRVEDLLDGPRLTLCLEDCGLGRSLGAQDRGLLLTLCGEDRGLLDALGVEDRRTAVPLGLHLLLHRLLDGHRRVDRLELDPVDADAPAAGRLVEGAAELAVDLVAAGQCLLQVERADDIAQGRDRQLLDALDEVGDLVHGALGVDHRVVDDRVDVDDQVVGGDDRLRREAHDLLAQVDVGAHPVDEGDEDVDPALEGAGVATESLDDQCGLLGHDPHGLEEHDEREEQ